jgi:ABC-2 type transport system permease protein
MEAKGLFNVARKEFIDHLTSRKFIIVLALFLIISVYSMHEGIDNYNDGLEDYKEQISQITEKEGIEPGYMAEKPSILDIFQMMSFQMVTLGGILAIAMGFDLISSEKESRSLKSLLSHPIFRDEIINGKALGGILALVFAIGIALIISFAMLLLFSIVPDLNEFWRIALFGVISVLCLLTYFSIALMTSTISENSGKSLIYAFIIFLAISVIVPIVGGIIAESVVGEPPEPPMFRHEIPPPTPSVNENESGKVIKPIKEIEIPRDEEEWQRYEEESKAYWEKRSAIDGAIFTLVPTTNYLAVSSAVLSKNGGVRMFGPGYRSETEGQDVLERIWKNILALIIFPIVFFAIAYVKFMRLDIR